ncbi:MAG TPA: cation:proton antiporter [archaeon]|nr:cation:proton antiporter [archaeon]
MEEQIFPLTTIGIILGFSLVLSFVLKRLGQNPVLGFILSGFLLGPFVFGFISPQDVLIESFAELGLFVLLFYLGIELSFKQFIKAGVPTLILALIDMIALAGTGFLIATLAGFSFIFSLVIGIMLFCTSSAIVGKFMLDRGLMQQESAQMGLAILILQDFLGIIVLVFVTSFSSSGSALQLSFTALVFAAVSFYVVHKLSKRVEKIFDSHDLSSTELTIYALGVGLLVATLGGFLNLSTAIGAYFAGFALSELRAGEKIKHQISFVRDFFLLFFFVSFGASLFFNKELNQIILPQTEQLFLIVGLAAILAIAIVVVNAVIFSVVGPLFSLTNRQSSEVAIFLTPLGEFVIIIAISVIPILPPFESAILSATAFLIILFTLLIFQPLYKNLDLHEKLTSMVPSIVPRPGMAKPVQEHTPESLKHLHDFGVNLILILCIGWIAMQLYGAIPEIGIPIPYGRAMVAFLLMVFFAAPLALKSIKALKKLWHISIGAHRHA